MGDLITFKPVKGGARLTPAPIDRSTVVVFTGVRQERIDVPQVRKVTSGKDRRASEKRPRKSRGKAGCGAKKQGAQRK